MALQQQGQRLLREQTRLGADANVYAAWQLATGNPDVIVAVIDQGVKYDREDLAANMWVNQAGSTVRAGWMMTATDMSTTYGYNFTNNTRASWSFS